MSKDATDPPSIPFAGFHGHHQETAHGSLLMTAGFKPTGPPVCKSVELQPRFEKPAGFLL
jgi:hypothetical protein